MQRPRRVIKKRTRITKASIEVICEFIRGWPRAITWEEIVIEAERRLHANWTRQALEKHAEIKAAYQAKRDQTPAHQPIDPAIRILKERIKSLEDDKRRLEAEIELYKGTFVRYQYNAHARGISPEELDRPLPPIDRNRSDG
ncbi:hypothetical protein ACFSM5_06805 [Lacibacterium aquatile]|uniref:Transcription factor n=1 Tax=Lacibacterium aquatile TaxID=1168082 RepID=A0ABW5DRQ3_9PROT